MSYKYTQGDTVNTAYRYQACLSISSLVPRKFSSCNQLNSPNTCHQQHTTPPLPFPIISELSQLTAAIVTSPSRNTSPANNAGNTESSNSLSSNAGIPSDLSSLTTSPLYLRQVTPAKAGPAAPAPQRMIDAWARGTGGATRLPITRAPAKEGPSVTSTASPLAPTAGIDSW